MCNTRKRCPSVQKNVHHHVQICRTANFFCLSINLDHLVDLFSKLVSWPITPRKCDICATQGVTTCDLSSLASFLKILSSKRVCCAFCDSADINAVNQGFWSKTAVFSLPATNFLLLFFCSLPVADATRHPVQQLSQFYRRRVSHFLSLSS